MTPKVWPPIFPVIFDRRQRVGDHPRVEQIDPSLEVVCAFEEEGSSLLEEELEGLVDGELYRIGLDLRKVGVEGAGESDIWRYAPGSGRPHFEIIAPLDLG
jgi:hypothetical protein